MSMQPHHRGLIYSMALVSAADSQMTDAEFQTIGEAIQFLPAFEDVDLNDLSDVTNQLTTLLQDEEGLDRALEQMKTDLPIRMRETAYLFATEVAAADGELHQEELRMLELIRHHLEIDRLHAAALERGTRARFMH